MAVTIYIDSAFSDRGVRKAIGSLDDFQKAAAIAGGGFSGNMQVAGKYVQAVGDDIANTGAGLSRSVTLPLALVGGAAIRSAADFEVAMSQMQVATGLPADQLKGMSDLALQYGADTIFSAGEAADAMLNLAKSGMTPAQIEGGALKSTLDLAAASGMALEEAAVVASSAMNTFGLSAEDSTQIVDALAGAANASSADLPDLSMALQQVGQQAAASGLSVQETTATLAAFADAGLRGSDAGTSMKTMLQRIAAPTGEAAAQIKELGMSFFDAQGNMKPMQEIAGELETGMKGLTQEQRLQAMQTIFGADATRAANVLYEEGAKGLAEYEKATNKTGTAQEMADARMGGLSGSIEQLKGSLETAAIQFGQVMAPAVQKVASFITDLVNRFSELSPGVKNVIVAVAAFAAALGPVLFIGGKIISFVGSFMVNLTKLMKVFGAVGKVFMWLSKIFMANPWILLIVAVVALAVLIYKNWDAIKEYLSAAWEWIKDTAAKVWNGIKDAVAKPIGAVKDFIRDAFDFVKNIFLNFTGAGLIIKHFDDIKDGIRNAIDAVKDLVRTGLDWVSDKFGDIFGGLKGMIETAFKGVAGVVKGPLNTIIGLVNDAIEKLNAIKVKIPSWSPIAAGQTLGFNIPTIPLLAAGGIVDSPTLAMIGEAGPEAVVPLSGRNARRAGGALGGTTVTVAPGAVVLNFPGGSSADRADVQRMIDDAFKKLAREVAAR